MGCHSNEIVSLVIDNMNSMVVSATHALHGRYSGVESVYVDILGIYVVDMR